MQVAVGGVVGLGASEVLALSFHPGRDELVMAAAGAHGYELIEADAITGHVLARTPLMRRLRHLWHQLSGTDAAVLILAYDCGDIEVWDSETRVQKDRMLPTKKDEGKAVTAVASGASHTGAVIYYARGGSAIERAEVGTSKSLRYGRFPGRAQVRRALGTLDACRRGGPVDACHPMGRARANPCAGLRCACAACSRDLFFTSSSRCPWLAAAPLTAEGAQGGPQGRTHMQHLVLSPAGAAGFDCGRTCGRRCAGA